MGVYPIFLWQILVFRSIPSFALSIISSWKVSFSKIQTQKIKILFSLQNLLKVLAFAVILRPWSLESVHGARRTVHLKFENWAKHGYCNFLPSLAKKEEKRKVHEMQVSKTSIAPFSELRQPILDPSTAKWPRCWVLSERFEEKTKFWFFRNVFPGFLFFQTTKFQFITRKPTEYARYIADMAISQIHYSGYVLFCIEVGSYQFWYKTDQKRNV